MNVTLNGYVVADDDQWLYDWFGIGAFSPAMVRQAVQDNPEGEDLVLEINSGGGSVFAGSEMYTVLRSSKVHSRAEIQSMAASAASYLCLGCSEVLISPVAQMMLHMPATSTAGDRVEHLRSIQLLDSTREAILNAYELKARGKADREAFRQMMNAETWLSAQEAVDSGLADGILFQDEDGAGAVLPQNLINAVGSGIRSLSMSSAVSLEGLRSRYEQLVRDGAKPADGHPVAGVKGAGSEPGNPTGGKPGNVSDDWKRKARLAIENNRFL